MIDFVVPLVPIGLGLADWGITNNELKQTDSSLGFLVDGVVLHPTQLYEAVLEGMILFLILWGYSRFQRGRGLSQLLFYFITQFLESSLNFLESMLTLVIFIATG